MLALWIWSGQPGSEAGKLLSCQKALSYIAWSKKVWHILLTLLHVCCQVSSTAKDIGFEVLPLGSHNKQLTFTTLYKARYPNFIQLSWRRYIGECGSSCQDVTAQNQITMNFTFIYKVLSADFKSHSKNWELLSFYFFSPHRINSDYFALLEVNSYFQKGITCFGKESCWCDLMWQVRSLRPSLVTDKVPEKYSHPFFFP